MKKISEKQQLANQNNAKLGGVKTEDGKDIIRFNARKHGILSEIVTDYERGILDCFMDQLFNDCMPVGFIEEMLTERIAISYFKLFRLNRVEKEFMKATINPTITESTLPQWETEKIVKEGYTQQIDTEEIELLGEKYHRYEKSLENRMYKAIHELERIQRMRKGEKVDAPITGEIMLSR